MKFKLQFLFVILVISFFANIGIKGQAKTKQESSANDKSVVEYSLCDVFNQPMSFEGKLIKMSVLYQESVMGNVLLTASACENSYMDFALDTENKANYKEAEDEVKKNLQFDELDDDRPYGEARISIIGVLEKNKNKGHSPIKNFLQDYTFRIKAVESEK